MTSRRRSRSATASRSWRGGRDCAVGRAGGDRAQPADDYVRDFIANVNPLSVLTAWNVMRDVRDLESASDRWIWLDRRKTTKFKISMRGKVEAAECEGKTGHLGDVQRGREEDPEGSSPVYWARPGTSLKTVILAMHKSGTAPVALFDETDRFVGAIGVRDVLASYSTSQGLTNSVARCDYFSIVTFVSGLLQQIRIMPASISRCRIPPPCVITTSPESFLLLQVPQTPLLQENGSRMPAARAASRMNWSGPAIDSSPRSGKLDLEASRSIGLSNLGVSLL